MEQNIQEKEFIKGITQKDKRVFALLFEKYHARLFRFAQSYIFDIDATEDIVQEVFIKLWEKTDLRIDRSLESYLFLMVKNRCIDYLRALHVEDKKKQKLMEAQILSDSTHIELDENAVQLIKRTISRLPDQCQQVYKFAIYDDMRYVDIAKELNISVNAVKVQMFRARKYLRENLARHKDSFFLFTFFNGI